MYLLIFKYLLIAVKILLKQLIRNQQTQDHWPHAANIMDKRRHTICIQTPLYFKWCATICSDHRLITAER